MSTRWRSALSQAMIEDLRVAIMPETAVIGRAMFDEMCDYVPPAADARISRVNGRQRIEFAPGGNIVFISHRDGLRGMSVDKLYVSIANSPPWHELEPAIATSRIGEIIFI